jgi:peptide/nickel transport system permease protein
MTRYIIRRLLLLPPTALLVLTLVFVVMHLVPGDAIIARIEMGTALRPEQLEAMREELGINDPLVVQYGRWLWDILQGDLGVSLATGRPVTEELLRAIPISIELAVLSQILALIVAVPVGVLSAVKQDSIWDYVARIANIGMLAAPSFWIATMVVVLGAYWFYWSPPLGYTPFWEDPIDNLKQFMLPAAILGLQASAQVMRMTRSTILEVVRQDYVRTARAKGLGSTRVLIVHVLKNAFIPVITVWGVSIAYSLNGNIIIETIFALPGIGLSIIDSIHTHDTVQLQANLLFFASAVVVVNIIVDLTYSWLDPRIRYS